MISERRADYFLERTQKISVRERTKLSRNLENNGTLRDFDCDKEIVNSYYLNVGDKIVSRKRKLSLILLKREITKYKVIE